MPRALLRLHPSLCPISNQNEVKFASYLAIRLWNIGNPGGDGFRIEKGAGTGGDAA
jgi:hypothetical protein